MALLLRPLLILVAALTLIVPPLAAPGPLNAQEPAIGIGIDADPAGNSAAGLGAIDSCIEVAAGERFQVDIFVQDVSDLLAWSAYLETDPNIVQVVDRDVQMFQAANPGSNVFDASDKTPDSDGVYAAASVDAADPPAPDSGSGVLARITLEAVGNGVSPLRLALRDLDGDATPDQGPLLRNVSGEIIGDDTGDTFFDGPIADAEAAVNASCPSAGEDGLDPLVIIGPVVGGIAVIALAGLAALFVLRRKRSAV